MSVVVGSVIGLLVDDGDGDRRGIVFAMTIPMNLLFRISN